MLVLNFTPFPELKTGRLLLRKLAGTDANEMFFLRSNENVLRYIGREPTKTIAEAEELLIRSLNLSMKMNQYFGLLLC
jgi:ribosomal-protein-alanine N-acetyltransferase